MLNENFYHQYSFDISAPMFKRKTDDFSQSVGQFENLKQDQPSSLNFDLRATVGFKNTFDKNGYISANTGVGISNNLNNLRFYNANSYVAGEKTTNNNHIDNTSKLSSRNVMYH